MSELHKSRATGCFNNQSEGSGGGKNEHYKSMGKTGTMKKETDIA